MANNLCSCVLINLVLNILYLTTISALNVDGVTQSSSTNSTISTVSTTENSRSDQGENVHGSHKFNSSDFTKLNLEVADLLGARWFEQNQKITVYHSVEIVDAMLIDKSQLSLRIEFYLQQRWVMTGVKLPSGLFKKDDPPHLFITAKESVLQHMWSPDSYISTSRDSGSVKSAALKSVVYIYPDMTIIYRAKMFANVACTTNFSWYPIDKQACLLAIEGYTYHDEFVQYQWEHDISHEAVSTKIERPLQYDLHGVNFTDGSVKRGNRGIMYPYVSIKFLFERKLGNSFIQIYVPTTLVVILTWFNFWLGLDAIPARMSLLVTAMLTLVTMHVGAKNTIPPVHYITMMDLWFVGCLTFVFCGVCEFVSVKYMHWRLHKVPENKYNKPAEDEKKLNELFSAMRSSMAPNPNLEVWEEDEEKQDRSKVRSARPRSRNLNTSDSQSLAPPSPSSQHQVRGDRGRGDQERSDYSLSISTTMLEVMEANNYGFRRDHMDEKVDSCRCSFKWFTSREMWIKVDMCSRVGFPFMFCVFNCIYWPILFKACEQEVNMNLST